MLHPTQSVTSVVMVTILYTQSVDLKYYCVSVARLITHDHIRFFLKTVKLLSRNNSGNEYTALKVTCLF